MEIGFFNKSDQMQVGMVHSQRRHHPSSCEARALYRSIMRRQCRLISFSQEGPMIFNLAQSRICPDFVIAGARLPNHVGLRFFVYRPSGISTKPIVVYLQET